LSKQWVKDMIEAKNLKESNFGQQAETVKECMISILDHVRSYIDRIRDEDIDLAIRTLLQARKIFIMGAGRSGLVGKAFAMRLMHLDLDVHVVGETTTPAFTDDDVLVTISGSGETNSVLTSAKVVKQKGGKVVAITSYPSSTLAQMADCLVIVKGRTKEDMPASYIERELHPYQRLTPMGTLFEDCCMIFLEGIVASLMEVLDKGEKDMKARHTVLE
jgi:3-hexulose-6-phosphate synthase/6-phospho-3-hexuloisomerase